MMKKYVLASDFDQTLSFNDSGIVLSELLGVPGFAEKAAGLSRLNLVQQGGELAYLLTFDHRVVDGFPAAAFLQTLRELLERPEVLVQSVRSRSGHPDKGKANFLAHNRRGACVARSPGIGR